MQVNPVVPNASVSKNVGRRRIERPRKIIVIEDHENLLDLLSRYLTGSGWDVLAAHGIHEFWDRQDQIPPAVILLDVGLVEGNGLEIARQVRANKVSRGVAILAMTGFSSQAAIQKCFDAGCDAILLKPFHLADLDRALADFIKQPTQVEVGMAAHNTTSPAIRPNNMLSHGFGGIHEFKNALRELYEE